MNKIKKEDIVDYVDKMEIKKANVGGFDRVDVYVHIQELLKMYGTYSDQELSRQKKAFEGQLKEIEVLKSAREELDARIAADDAKDEELKKQKERVSDLMHYKEMADSLQGENRAQNKRINGLKKVEELVEALSKENVDLHQENEKQKKEIEELKKSEADVSRLKNIAVVSDEKVRELSEELEKCKIYTIELETDIQIQKKEIDELNQYKDQAMRLQKEVDMQKEKIERLRQYGTHSEGVQEQLNSRTTDMLELKDELKKRTDETQELRRELQEKQEEIAQKEEFYSNVLRSLENAGKAEADKKDSPVSMEMERKLKEQERIIMEKEQRIYSVMQELEGKEKELEGLKEERNVLQSSGAGAYSYTQEIGEILSEARREGQNIIDQARIEAEQEMVKLLNLRAKYNKELEVYQNWCRRVEMEKKSVEEFLKQLSDQYVDADRVLNALKEKASSFDVNRFLKVIDSQQSSAEEVEYEEKGME